LIYLAGWKCVGADQEMYQSANEQTYQSLAEKNVDRHFLSGSYSQQYNYQMSGFAGSSGYGALSEGAGPPEKKPFLSALSSEETRTLDDANLLESGEHYYTPSWAEQKIERVCGCLSATKKGNMFLVGEFVKRSGSTHKLILGPQWPLLCVLYMMLTGGTIFVYGLLAPEEHSGQVAVGLTLSVMTLATLTVVAFRDPGIVPRHTVPKGQLWTFCDQCDSFRPPNSVHCSLCNVCIEEYDHHCSWTSKCVGRSNLRWFRVFLLLLAATMVFDILVCLQRAFQTPLIIYY